ncbi:hypothetical protein CEXT_593541 [Caerostris extrusa]|uniref:Uncharacterized protein n=1 Tax=Caerostris extrusa TaxID=172846 RepID=A0AAV4NHP5_CAEEX|nr:hypothetical protein CEXT_593541 [Caerostris extrusa]
MDESFSNTQTALCTLPPVCICPFNQAQRQHFRHNMMNGSTRGTCVLSRLCILTLINDATQIMVRITLSRSLMTIPRVKLSLFFSSLKIAQLGETIHFSSEIGSS